MKAYPAAFTRQIEKVEKLEEKLEAERKKLQGLCPHVNLDGTSAFPHGLSFTDCRLCGESSYYAGR